MADLYKQIHEYFNSLERYSFPYDKKELERITDKNGLYILFENGEKYEKYDRIVRIGSHDSDDRLIKRLRDHFLSSRQRKSIFRKHIGRCFLNSKNDDYLNAWDKPFNKTADKEKHKEIVDLKYEQQYEELITTHIRTKLSFVVIPKVYEKLDRDRIEEGLIASLAQSDLKISSSNWLGNEHPKIKIRQSKIWNIKFLNGNPLTEIEFINLIINKYGG
ncbi:MAG: hypothetical protein GQ564_08565 [Bacteroidales bacterium]|nr:hypothetical protein [Bacteroidales bacterium]